MTEYSRNKAWYNNPSVQQGMQNKKRRNFVSDRMAQDMRAQYAALLITAAWLCGIWWLVFTFL